MLVLLFWELFWAPAYSEASALPPFDLSMQVFVLIREINFKGIRQRDAIRNLETSAVSGGVADDTVHAGESIVEMDSSFEEGLMADKRAAFDHCEPASSS